MAGKTPKGLKIKKVVYSKNFYITLTNVLLFGKEQFGSKAAHSFSNEVQRRTKMLSSLYLSFPENRIIRTKTKIYRNIIYGKYMILYRIKSATVEVLAIYHSSIKPARIKKLRSAKP